MGLDWRPMNKPKPGFEDRFAQIFRIVQGTELQKQPGFWDKLKGNRLLTRDELIEEFRDISIEAFETIKAPRVGVDPVADEWIRAKYQESDKAMSEGEFVKKFLGYYVVELAQEQEGVPSYQALTGDMHFFRAQFLADCEDEIGADMLNEAWVSKLPDDAHDYGLRLLHVANSVAGSHNLVHLKDIDLIPDWEEDSIESKVHIMYSAAKWLLFYSSRGHGYEADY